MSHIPTYFMNIYNIASLPEVGDREQKAEQ